MKELIGLFIVCFGAFSFAEEAMNFAVLSSFRDPGVEKGFVRKIVSRRIDRYVDKIESRLKKEFAGVPLRVNLVKQATVFELWNAIHDPDITHVIWLSHGSDKKKNLPVGVSSDAAIVDYNGFDVSKVLKDVPSRIKFVGLLSCNSHKALQKTGIANENRFFGFDEKVSLKKSMKLAIAKIRENVKDGSDSATPAHEAQDVAEKLKSIRILRQASRCEPPCNLKFPAVMIRTGSKVWGVLPEVKADEPQEAVIEVPANTHRLAVDAGDLITGQLLDFDLGQLEVSSDDSTTWSVYADSNGVPLGVTKRLFSRP